MVDYASLSIILTGIGIIGAITYYSFQIRNQNRIREAQMLIQIWQKFSDPDFLARYMEIRSREWSDYEEYKEKYSYEVDPENYVQSLSVGTTLSGVGVLVGRKFIDPGYVDDLMSTVVLNYWEKQKPVIYAMREEASLFSGGESNPQIGEWIELLYNEVKSIAKKQHPDRLQ